MKLVADFVASYAEYLESDSWRRKAEEAKRRAGHQCALCPNRHRLEVHHRTYDRIGHERPSDLVVLCWWCHRRHHATLQSTHRQESSRQLGLPFAAHIPEGSELN